MPPLAPELEVFRRELEQLAADAETLTSGLSDEQFNWHPEAGGWSVAQCLEHLNVTARAYLPAMDEGIADGIRRGLYGEGPFRYNLIARLIVRSMEPPARMKFRSPKVFMPPPRRGRQETLAAFRAYQVQYVDRLRQSNGLDLARTRITSPAAYGWLRLPLGAAFALTTAHERRHLWQARQRLSAAGFPR